MHAKLCGEGLECQAEHPNRPGGSGTCVRRSMPVFVGEGETCTGGGVGPAHAKLCSEGLECRTQLQGRVGGSGTCVRREGGNSSDANIFLP